LTRKQGFWGRFAAKGYAGGRILHWPGVFGGFLFAGRRTGTGMYLLPRPGGILIK